MNPLELKVEHYKQRVAELSVSYEEQVANLRVQLTLLDEELKELKKSNETSEETVPAVEDK